MSACACLITAARRRARQPPRFRRSHCGSQAAAQGSRLELLEHAIRTITSELTNERKIISGVLHDLQRELMAQREETSRLGGITQDRIQALFGDRLQSLEQTLVNTRSIPDGELGQLQDRFATHGARRSAGPRRRAHGAGYASGEAGPRPTLRPSHIVSTSSRKRCCRARLSDRLRTLEDGFAAERDRATSTLENARTKADEFAGTLQRLPGDVAALIQPVAFREHRGVVGLARKPHRKVRGRARLVGARIQRPPRHSGEDRRCRCPGARGRPRRGRQGHGQPARAGDGARNPEAGHGQGARTHRGAHRQSREGGRGTGRRCSKTSR